MMFKHSFQIKLGFFIFGLIIVFTVFGLNWYMIKKIREDAREQVEYLAKAYTDAINNLEPANIQYVLEILMPSINFPMIITSNDEIYAVKNLHIEEDENTLEYDNKIRSIINRMDRSFDPLPVTGNNIEISRIHYGDPEIIGKLQWVPYLEVGLVILFIVLGFIGLQFIRNSEKNSIWMGMARETAHQLGTPISSLMGWIKLLEDGENPKDIVQAIQDDLMHLSHISNRFQKIGSKAKLNSISLLKLAEKTAAYMRIRIPSSSHIDILVKGEDILIKGEETLLSWALENMVKNALEAFTGKSGTIMMEIIDSDMASLQISDTGGGIARKNRNHIFRPGFSTKKRGWGLGLSLTRRIIEDIHKGKITLISSKPGGTVFRIDLPTAEPNIH